MNIIHIREVADIRSIMDGHAALPEQSEQENYDLADEVLSCLAARLTVNRKVALVFAHPDDEAIGVGGSLHLLPNLVLVQATDGVPPDSAHAHRRGFSSTEAYGITRREEMRQAIAASGQPNAILVELGYGDQTTTSAMAAMTLDIVCVLREHQIEALVTHPYEGGHPDHDSTALACQAAVALLARERQHIAVLEMTSYHASSKKGYLRSGRFMWSEQDSPPEVVAVLGSEERAFKHAMFTCHASQLRTLLALMTGPILQEERFRTAPVYDFSRAPPPDMGAALYYEARVSDWGMTGEIWRYQAAMALKELALP